MSHPILNNVEAVCQTFSSNGIYSVGAIAALRAMSAHWDSHFAEGHPPTIIENDIEGMFEQLRIMRTEIMRRVNQPVSANPKLTPYRVSLHEAPGDKFKIIYDCLAEDEDGAISQAEIAHPGCEIVLATPFDDDIPYYAIYSPNESAVSAGAGFWSNDEGWCEFAAAERFTQTEKASFNLPISTGRDAIWVLWEDANKCYGGKDKPNLKVEPSTDCYQMSAHDIESVLWDYTLRVTNTAGKSFVTMSEELVDEIDRDRVENAALAAGDDRNQQILAAHKMIHRILVEQGVIEF